MYRGVATVNTVTIYKLQNLKKTSNIQVGGCGFVHIYIFLQQAPMARKSVATGDIIELDRGKIYTDLRSVKRLLRNGFRGSDEDETKKVLQRGIKEIGG